MKAHIGVDADSGLVHTVVATPANVHDLVVAGDLLHGDEAVVHGDSGYRGIARWCDTPDVDGGHATGQASVAGARVG